jgi:hypothetical protein
VQPTLTCIPSLSANTDRLLGFRERTERAYEADSIHLAAYIIQYAILRQFKLWRMLLEASPLTYKRLVAISGILACEIVHCYFNYYY